VNLGSVTLSQDLKNVGNVFDVFGPVENPYISVKPNIRDPKNYVGQLIYVDEGLERRRSGNE
jgi:rRNA processing protein Gar1